MSQKEIDSNIDKNFYEEFERVIMMYKKFVGDTRFSKLMEKFMPSDPSSSVPSNDYKNTPGGSQNKNLDQEGPLYKFDEDSLKLTLIKEIRDQCFTVAPSELKMLSAC